MCRSTHVYVFHYEFGLILNMQSSILHCSRNSWSAHSWCQNKALYLIAPPPLNSSHLLTHLLRVLTGNEVTA